MNQKFAVRLKQIGYALVALLASNIVLLILFLLNAMRIRSSLLAAHMGRPGQQISLALQLSAIYGFFLFFGMAHDGITNCAVCARQFHSSFTCVGTAHCRHGYWPFCLIGVIRDSQSWSDPRSGNVQKHGLSVGFISPDVSCDVFALLCFVR